MLVEKVVLRRRLSEVLVGAVGGKGFGAVVSRGGGSTGPNATSLRCLRVGRGAEQGTGIDFLPSKAIGHFPGSYVQGWGPRRSVHLTGGKD